MSYEQPDKGEKFTPSEHPEWLGKLFLIWPESVETVTFSRPDGSQEPTDIVTADVAIIDLVDPETGKPKFIKGARIGGKALVGQLKGKVARKAKCLGRLSQSPRQGQKSGAYFISDWTPQDVQMAEQYEAAFPRITFEQPSGAAPAMAAAPAAQAWGAPQPPPPVAPSQPQMPQQWAQQQMAQAAPALPPGLEEFLKVRGMDPARMDVGTAVQIANSLGWTQP